MFKSNPFHIVVGAGMSGLFAARLLKQRGVKNVLIVEQAPEIGGLLRSDKLEGVVANNIAPTFDYGTHFILSYKNHAMDTILRHDIDDRSYHIFNDSLPEGHVLNGKLYDRSGCASITALAAKDQTQIVKELKALHAQGEQERQSGNLQDALETRFGRTATRLIYQPAFEKFTGRKISDLGAHLINSFAPPRLIAFPRADTIVLKKDPDWNRRIGYADYTDGFSSILKYYPKSGGISHWVDTLAQSLTDEGVVIKTGTSLTKVKSQQGCIDTAFLSDGSAIACERLIWTVPSILLKPLLDFELEMPSSKPHFRQVLLTHFLIDSKPLADSFWINVYDSDKLSYRITLYDNFAEHQGEYRLTVECLHDGELTTASDVPKHLFKELRDMGIISLDTQNIFHFSKNIPAGFPVLSTQQISDYKRQVEILETAIPNLTIINPSAVQSGSQLEILDRALEKLHGASTGEQGQHTYLV